jgi:hypothetical protein
MDNQFAPRPPEPVETRASSEEVEQPQANPVAIQPKTTRFKVHFGKKVMWVIVLLVFLAAAGGGVYYMRQQQMKSADEAADMTSKNHDLSARVNFLNKQILAEQAKNPAQPADAQVLAAVKNFCNAGVDSKTKKPLVMTVIPAGPAKKQVLYSTDKNYATVNAVCSKDGKSATGGSTYYLKKVNMSWVLLYDSQAAVPENTAKFNIPSQFN